MLSIQQYTTVRKLYKKQSLSSQVHVTEFASVCEVTCEIHCHTCTLKDIGTSVTEVVGLESCLNCMNALLKFFLPTILLMVML